MLFNDETIEAYVSGKLTGADKSLFESRMAQEPLLRNEVELQQDIRESLRSNRKAELKQRMNQIDMSTANLGFGRKVAASLFISGLVGTALFMAVDNTAPSKITATATTSASSAVSTPAAAENTVKAETQVSANNQEIVQQAPQQQNPSRKATAKNTTTTQNTEISVVVPKIDVPASADIETSGNGTTPQADFNSSASVSKLNNVSVEVKAPAANQKGYAYQYFNDKLFLYGNIGVNGSNVNILEFNKNGQKQLFLYINSKYYGILNNQTAITPLKAITDAALINQLNSYSK